ncbi:MAG: hypothetical protein DBY35_08710 [Bacteroidales bacterium]|nr:MAG: hypothetical protein DBY35_08710 [Bacteroidales bacterium]
MKKKFLKVALFSLIMAAPATSFVSCTDYDDDITNLTTNDDKLQEEFNNKLEQQAKTLEAKIAELQTAQTALETQAKQAGEAADAAAKAAADAAKAAEAAQKTGDQATADAQAAQAEAMKANAAAEAALKAVDEAKAAVLAQTIEQMEALKKDIEGQIAALEAKYGKDFDTLTAAIAECAKQADVDNLKGSIEGLEGEIDKLQAQIDGIKTLSPDEVNALIKAYLTNIGINETTISAINGNIAALDLRIDGVETAIEGIKTDVAGNTTLIANIMNEIIPGLKEELEGKISALDTKVTEHITAFNEYKTKIETQLQALKTFKDTYEALLQGLSQELTDIKDELSDLDDKIDGVAGDLSTLQNQVNELTGENGLITTLKGTVEEQGRTLSTLQSDLGKLQTQINGIASNLNVLAQKSSKRLTSITLVPTAYRDGIPNIDFFTAEFTPLGKLNKETGLYDAPATGAKKVSINSEKAKVLYRLNPAGVTVEDILAPSFVQTIATSRAANEPVLNVVSFQKSTEDASILEVFATKNVDTKIDNAGSTNNFYTVALKVPIAKENLYTWTETVDGNEVTVTEKAEDAVVYSEYARVSDTWFTPAVTATPSVKEPAWSEDNLYTWDDVKAADVLAKVDYQKPTDLTQFVTGCMNYDGKHSVMTADEMALFGFTIECNLFGQKYEVGSVNQQDYATVKDGVLTPATPKDGNILDRLGKTPVIEVVMKDAKGNVIAQKFFRVELSLSDAKTDFTIGYDEFELTCDTKWEVVTWKQINDVIISQLGFDMNKDQFVANYAATTVPNGVTVNLAATGEDIQPISWLITVADMMLDGENKTLSKVIKFTNAAGLYPELTLTLKVTVNWPSKLPAFGELIPALWNNNTLRVLPEAMAKPYVAGVTATYNTNVLQGRKTPYLTNLLDCSEWDLVFATAPKGYEVNEDNSYEIVLPGEKETDAPALAATLWYGETDKATYDLDKDDASDNTLEANFFIENNAAGIAMVEQEMTIGLGWNIELTGVGYDNPYTLGNTSIKIIKPLQKAETANIEPIKQNSVEQTRNLAAGLTITDAFGNKFQQYNRNTLTDYWQYYDITDVDWTSKEMSITDKAGNNYSLKDFNLHFDISDDGELTYTGSGAALNESVTLNVPVVITHKWGELETSVHVTINPGI